MINRSLVVILFLAGSVSAEFQARAVLKAVDRAVLSSELAARITELPVRAGGSFRKGDLLVGLDCQLYQAQETKVASEKKAAVMKLGNVVKLNDLKSVGALEVALAETHLEQVQASLKMARINTDRCQIKAPYDGRVVNLLVNRYEVIDQQQELVEIVNNQQVKAEVVAPTSWLTWLREGIPVKLTIDESSIVAEGVISAVSPAIDPASQTVLIHVKLVKNAGLIPGMSATAELKRPTIK